MSPVAAPPARRRKVARLDPRPADSPPVVEVGLWPKQVAVFEATERSPAVLARGGRGSGKSHVGAIRLATWAPMWPGAVHLATANTYRQCEDVVVPALRAAFEALQVPVLWRRTDMDFVVPTRGEPSTIHVRSMENFDQTLRGLTICKWWGDEVRDYRKKAILVTLATLRSAAGPSGYLWTTTGRGYDYAWVRHEGTPLAGSELVVLTSRDNHSNPQGFVEMLEASYDELFAEQEIEGGVVDVSGRRAYHAYSDAANRRDDIEHHPAWPLILHFDFNVTPYMTCVLGHEPAPDIWWFDEICPRSGLLDDVCNEILERYGHHQSQVVVTGDAAGHQRDSKTGKGHYTWIKERLGRQFGHRLSFEEPRANPPVVDRLIAMNACLKNSRGEPHAFVHPRCKHLIEDLQRCRFDDDGRFDKSDSDLTHASDAVGYRVWTHHRPQIFSSEPGGSIVAEGASHRRKLRERYGRRGDQRTHDAE